MKNTELEAVSKATLARISSTALALVNDARTALGMRPLFAWFKGYRHQADRCPVAYALATGDESTIPLVDGTTLLFGGDWYANSAAIVAAAWGRKPEGERGEQVVLPFEVASFVRLFDQGHYPELTKPVVPETKAVAA